jgi:hypothetical protein
MTKNQKITKDIMRLKNGGIFAFAATGAWHLNEETLFVNLMRETVNDVIMEDAIKYYLSEEIIKELKS